MNELTHIDLFSGIGGFALAARWAGIKTVQFVEIDKFCHKVLNKNFPGVPIHDDIKTFKWTGTNPFILTGGFPCQPFSCAGKQRGTDDNRYLWPEMLRVISEAKPKWIIGENVKGFISNNNGMVFENCCLDLEREGYAVQAFIIPACAVNAPHRRDRVWIVANRRCEYGEGTEVNRKLNRPLPCEKNASMSERPTSNDGQGINTNSASSGCLNGCSNREERHIQDITIRKIEEDKSERNRRFNRIEPSDSHAPDTTAKGFSHRRSSQMGEHTGKVEKLERCSCTRASSQQFNRNWLEVATRLCRVDDGVPRKVDRVNRLKALGNAVVPQVAAEIMKAILQAENEA